MEFGCEKTDFTIFKIIVNTMAYAGPPFAEAFAVSNAIQSKILRDWGLQYCLQYDKENLFIQILEDRPFEMRKDVSQGRLDVKDYLDDELKYYKALNSYRFNFCLRLYNSKEYQQEMERIVKKYCKDCE